MSVLEARGLRKAFGGVRAVADVSFSLAAGELLAMIGPNGAGKSTCFNLIGGQLRPDAGEVLLGGTVLRGLQAPALCRLGIGRTFQLAAAFASMTVEENVQVAIAARERRLGALFSPLAGGARAETRDVLAKVGLQRQSSRACAELAYGDLKRVELALALAGRPRVLLMDEPTAGMAPAERRALMQLAVALARDERIGVLFTEHDMDAVFAHADRILVLADGRVIAEGAPAEVRRDAEVRRVYLGEEPGDA
ncbi:MAG TPA: ABC transporter ATP-binding protein [Burkholderiales bacterium]|nr:ABC transporter ATP-binding protein [Burkholderiales bacterium]